MNKSQLIEILNMLFGAQVEGYQFDLLNHRISFKIKLIYFGNITNYKLDFVNVSSWVFLDKNSKEYGNYDWEKIEITTAYYSDKNDLFIKFNDQEEKNIFNFLFELWESELYILAEKVIINDTVFEC